MIHNLQDGRRALGFGLMFAAYTAFLLWDEYHRRARDHRMNVARSHRDELIASEMVVNNGS